MQELNELAIMNSTLVEEDPFISIDNDDFGHYEHAVAVYFDYFHFFTEIVKLILIVAVVVADILLTYVILKFKRLKTSTNYFILHYAISNILYMIVTPIFYILLQLLPRHITSNYYFCIIYVAERTALFTCFTFSIVIALDWIITVFKPELLIKYGKIYKNLSIIIYIAMLLLFILNLFLCSRNFDTFENILNQVMLISCWIVVILANVFKRKRNVTSKIDYALSISTFLVLSWLPNYFYHLAMDVFMERFNIIAMVVWSISFILDYFAYSGPIVVLCILGKKNKHFKMAFDRIFKRSVRNYGSDNLDDVSDIEEKDNCAVSISNDNQTSVLVL